MNEFWNKHELDNLEVTLYVLQFFIYGLMLGILLFGRITKKKKHSKKKDHEKTTTV
jgi:hypothetical protein